MNINGIKNITGIFFPNLKIVVKVKLKITDNKIINNKKNKKKFFVSSKTKKGFLIQNKKLIKKPNPKTEKYLKVLKLLYLFLFESNIKQRKGNIIKPSGKKKYGGNKSEVKNPNIKYIKVFNYFYLLQQFQFFYCSI